MRAKDKDWLMPMVSMSKEEFAAQYPTTDAVIIERLAIGIYGWKPCNRIARGWGHGPNVWLTGDDREDGNPTKQGWNPLESWADVMELQAAIPTKMGPKFRREYTQALNLIAWDTNNPQSGRDWSMISATPRQRCMAMISALEAR